MKGASIARVGLDTAENRPDRSKVEGTRKTNQVPHSSLVEEGLSLGLERRLEKVTLRSSKHSEYEHRGRHGLKSRSVRSEPN